MASALTDLAKVAFFKVAGSAPVLRHRVRALRQSGRLTILNFHRVADDDGSSYPPLSPAMFEEAIRFAVRHFNVLTFGGLSDYRPRNGKPPLIVSFDDGYRDFVDHAAPIMRRHGVRCNLNVIPACIETGLPPLNVHIQDFVGRAPAAALSQLQVPGFGEAITGDRSVLGSRLSNYLKNRPMAEQKALADRILPQLREVSGFAPTAMMTFDDVQAVAEEHELGAHSFEHATLDCEDDEYVRRDAAACRDYFAGKLGVQARIYALPNGAARPGVHHILHRAGFEHILLTGEGYSAPAATSHPRFTMTGTSRAEVRFRSTGFVRG